MANRELVTPLSFRSKAVRFRERILTIAHLFRELYLFLSLIKFLQMKLTAKSLALLPLVFFSINTNAQKIKTTEGDLSVLKNESAINFEFIYDGMTVGKYANEQDYLKAKTEEYNKKEPGRGDTWAKSWVTDRASRFEPKFIELFMKYGNVSAKKDAKYTLIFKTISTEPGYNVVISRKNAEIDAEVWIVETANRSKKIATLTVSNAPAKLLVVMITILDQELPKHMLLQEKSWVRILSKMTTASR